MIAFHFIFDLFFLKIIDFNIFTNDYTMAWRGFMVTTFLLSVGILSHLSNGKLWSKSTVYLFIAISIISISSYILAPKVWIYFGMLHLIFVSKLLIFAFRKKPYLSLCIAIAIFILFYLFGSYNPFAQYPNFFPRTTADIAHIIPWLAVPFLGIFVGYKKFYKLLPCVNSKPILFAGKYSLIIYMTHQLILFPIVFLIYITIN